MSAESQNYPEYFYPQKPESLREQLQFENIRGQNRIIDGNATTLYDPGDIGLPRTGYFAVLGEFHIGTDRDTEMVVVRERRGGADTYQVHGLSTDDHGDTRINGRQVILEQGQELVIGREHDAMQFWDKADIGISRKHLVISVLGDRIHIQDSSMNGTKAAGLEVGKIDPPEVTNHHIAEHTIRAEEAMLRLNSRSEIIIENGETYVDGRVSVGRDTVINADRPAIDIRSWIGGGESIVIDSKKYPEQFDRLMTRYEAKLKSLTRNRFRRKTEEMKLRAVFEAVSEAMEYDLGYVEKWEGVVGKKPKEGMRKVTLDTYLEEGKGVCRHMALAAAWLGGELAREGKLQGRTTAGVNQRKHDNAAHEWARYTTADGVVYIIDPAQKRFGKLTDFLDDKKAWEYFRPGERNKYDALLGKGDVDPAHVVLNAEKVVPRIWK